MLKFLLSRQFIIHLSVATLTVLIFIWVLLSFIDSYTNNGQTITIPLLTGYTINEVEEDLKDKNLRFEILDSVYVEGSVKGIVLDQSPEGNDLVKENRTIYLTISKFIAPMISLPDVVDMSQRLAVAKLESYGLKIGRLDYIPSECLNCVVKMHVKGKEVFPDDQIAKGSVVNLTLGGGTSNELVLVPYLINSTKNQVLAMLQATFLNLGAEIFEDCKTKSDSLSAKAYKQSPNRTSSNAVNMGSSVDVWFTLDESKINYSPPNLSDSLNLSE